MPYTECTFPYFIIFTTQNMGLQNTLHRMIADPDSHERFLLEADIAERREGAGGCTSASFLNSMAGDLDAQVIGIHKNTDQRLIIVTQDKTLLTLKRNIAKLGKKEWIAPLSTLSTILIALITSNFKWALGLGPSEWRAMFIVSGLLSAGWLLIALKQSFGAKTFHDVICDICYELGARPKPEPSSAVRHPLHAPNRVFAFCKAKVTERKKSRVVR